MNYSPTQEYVTAFNTWRTSEKSRRLEHLFFKETTAQKALAIVPAVADQGFLFKVCRVQNPYDLAVTANGGANMIGIHAVFPDRFKYLEQQRKYRPLYGGEKVNEALPVATMEIDSIRAMQRIMPKGMKQAILFEERLAPALMEECCELYGLQPKNTFIQLQYRTDRNHVRDVKATVSSNAILAMGLFQPDLEKYFWDMHEALDPEHDYILLDMSQHQPDLISGMDQDAHDMNKVAVLRRAAISMAGNNIPVILADDTSPKLMKKYLEILKAKGVLVAGIDMQNNLEVPTQEQAYQFQQDECGTYHARTRKSPDHMKEWKNFAYLAAFNP